MDKTVIEYKEEFWENGNRKHSRTYFSDLTSVWIHFDIDGNIESKMYAKHGHMSCENGPSYIQYYPNGRVKKVCYYNGVTRRITRTDGGPAVVQYDKRGELKRLEWYLDSVLHRDDGPAVVSYQWDNVKPREHHYLNGVFVTKDELDYTRKYFEDNPQYAILHLNSEDHIKRYFAKKSIGNNP